MAPDGYIRQVLTFNGTIPGPAIIANWGDTLVIHVTNSLANNGYVMPNDLSKCIELTRLSLRTAIHWHGIRQLGTPEADGSDVLPCCLDGVC
jgi:FtsP/CotA-like multicopper oxidase with cupredoxin domain